MAPTSELESEEIITFVPVPNMDPDMNHAINKYPGVRGEAVY